MKQLGNLAIVCAKRKDTLLQVSNSDVSVHIGTGPERKTLSSKWDDDEKISSIITKLNFEEFREER